MRKLNQRFKGNRPTEGPLLGAFATPSAVTIRVVAKGERPTLPRASVRAASDDVRDILAAATEVQARIMAALLRPIPVAIAL